MAYDSMTATLTASLNAPVAKNLTGTDYTPLSTTVSITKKIVCSKTIANASAGGADELISKVYTAAASGTVSIDLTSLVDALQVSGISLARVKGLLFRLLSVADDATNGTACSSVTIGNAGSNPNIMFLDDPTHGVILSNGDFIAWGTPQAAGIAVSSSHKVILITNNDSGNGMAVQVSILGGTS